MHNDSGRNRESEAGVAFPNAAANTEHRLYTHERRREFIMSEQTVGMEHGAMAMALEEQRRMALYNAECERDAREDNMESPAFVHEAASASMESLFANVQDEYFDWLRAHDRAETGGAQNRRDLQVEARRLRRLSHAYVELRKTLNESGMCMQSRAWRGGIVDLCRDLHPRFLLRVSHNFIPGFDKLQGHARNAWNSVKSWAPIQHMKKKFKSMASSLGINLKLVAAAKAAWTSLKPVRKCLEQSNDKRFKLKTMLGILGQHKHKGVAHNVDIIKSLFKTYVGRTLKDMRMLLRRSFREAMPRLKRMLAAPKGMSIAEFFNGAWLTKLVSEGMAYLTMMSKWPELGVFGCATQHLVIPAIRVLMGSIRALVLKGLKSMKDTFSYLSNRAQRFMVAGILKLLNKYPTLKDCFSTMVNIAYTFCMRRTTKLRARVKDFVIGLQRGNATEAKFKELHTTLTTPFGKVDMPTFLKKGAGEVMNYTSELVMDLVRQGANSVLALEGKLEDMIRSAANKVIDFAVRVLIKPLMYMLRMLKTAAIKFINTVLDTINKLLKNVMLAASKYIIDPLIASTKDLLLSAAGGVEYLTEGLLGIAPHAGAGIGDIVVEPLQFVQTVLTGQIPKIIGMTINGALKVMAWLLKKVQHFAVGMVDKALSYALKIDFFFKVTAKKAVDEALAAMRYGTQTALSTLVSKVQSAMNKVVKKFSGITTNIPIMLENAFKNAFGGKLQKATRWILTFLSPLINVVKTVFRNVTDGLSGKMSECDRTRENLAEMLKSAWDVGKSFQEVA